jgi:hypothetical protein
VLQRQVNGYYVKKALKDLAMMYDDKIDYNVKKIKLLKETNANAPTQELETQITTAQLQKQKIVDVFNGIK